jgi:hypothetical protein
VLAEESALHGQAPQLGVERLPIAHLMSLELRGAAVSEHGEYWVSTPFGQS